MANILCIETSSTNCSVAIANEQGQYQNAFGIESCLDLMEDNSDSYSHGERLHVFIQEILERNGLDTSDLDAIAVSEGPGSYTGLRIGVSTVKGICYALNLPMIGISTLEALSRQATSKNTYTISMLDARRMEVYAAVFKDDRLLEAPKAVILDKTSFSAYREAVQQDSVAPTITFIGTGIEKFEEIIPSEGHTFIKTHPTAISMCDLALEKFESGDTVDVAYFEPFYLKEFKAG